MKKISCVFALMLIFLTSDPLHSQSEVTGTWQTTGVPGSPWTFEFKADGARLTGSAKQNVDTKEIYDGRIDGNTIVFKTAPTARCANLPPCETIITFTGKINGAEITFVRDVAVPEGHPRLGNGLFGASNGALREFTARRGTDDEPGAALDTAAAAAVDQGVEFSAAVHVLQKDIKVIGTLFLP